MTRPIRLQVAVSALLVLGGLAHAQPPRNPPPSEPVPPELVLHDLHAAYSKTTADEMTVRFRAAGGPERLDDLTVRVQAGPEGPQKMLLDIGPLRIYAAAGRVTAISTAAPGKYVQKLYTGRLTPAALGTLMPPVPLPQLLLADPNDPFREPTPYTRGVTWASAVIEEVLRTRTVTLTGAGKNGQVTAVANAENGRLMRLSAALQAREGQSTLELQVKPVDPGDPDTWAIRTEGLQRVGAITDLRPTPRPMAGEAVPDLTFTKAGLAGRWSLYDALAAAARVAPGEGQPPAPQPGAIVLFRYSLLADRAAQSVRDAKAGLAVLRLVIHGRPLPGEAPGSGQPVRAVTASAVVMELSEFTQDRWAEAARGWGMQARGRSPAAPLDLTADELMWSPSSAALDRFAPGAGAVILVVGPDRALRGVVRLDGRAEDVAGIGKELRGALTK